MQHIVDFIFTTKYNCYTLDTCSLISKFDIHQKLFHLTSSPGINSMFRIKCFFSIFLVIESTLYNCLNLLSVTSIPHNFILISFQEGCSFFWRNLLIKKLLTPQSLAPERMYSLVSFLERPLKV